MNKNTAFNQLIFSVFFNVAFMIGMFLQMFFFCKGASLLTKLEEGLFFVPAIICFLFYDKSRKIRIFILPFQIIGAIAMCIEEKSIIIYFAAFLSFTFAYFVIKEMAHKKY